MTAFLVPSNPAFDTFTALVEALNDWMDRNDLTGAAPQMIALAEDEMRAELQPFFLETSTSIATTDGVGALPTDYRKAVRVGYDGCALPQVSVAAGYEMPAYGMPHAYTLERNAIRIWPAGNYTINLLYRPKLARLTEGSPTNELLSEFPSLYFYGAMVFANGYVADDSRAATFRSLFDNMKAKAVEYFKCQRHGSQLTPVFANVP